MKPKLQKAFWWASILSIALPGCSRSEADIARGEFLSGCVKSADKSTCSCIYEELSTRYTEKALSEFGTHRPFPDDFTQRSFESTLKCSKK